jgi:ADP-ribosylglycohydrolase
MIENPVLGAIAGDMIGVPYECLRHGVSVSPNFPLWGDRSTFSDDSVMTLAVAKWLLESEDFNYEVLIKCMQELGRKYRDRGYGSSFGQWLDTDNPKPYNSWGNGSAMRVSPVGVVSDKEENVLAIAGLTANVSHNHPEGIKGAQAIAFCVWAAHNNWSKSAIKIGLRDHIHDYDLNRTPQQIMDSGYTFKVSCQESVPEAICCFLNSDSYEETIRKAILLRGDTDTQAAMAGSIAAAYWGIPEDIEEECKERLPQDLYVILSKFSKKYNLPL